MGLLNKHMRDFYQGVPMKEEKKTKYGIIFLAIVLTIFLILSIKYFLHT